MLKTIFFLVKALAKANKYLKYNLKDTIGAEYYSFFSRKELKRVEQYLRFHHLFGESLCLLFGRKMTEADMQLFSAMSIIAPIFDDFFDKSKRINVIRLNRLSEIEDFVENKTEKEKIAKHFLNFIYKKITLTPEFKTNLQKLINAQRNDKRLQVCGIDRNEIIKAEAKKGGISAILYALLLAKKEYSEKEYSLFFELGVIGQFVDDIFDFYEDRENSITTQANIYKNPHEISAAFEEKFKQFKQNLHNSNYEKKDIASFLAVINMVISSARVCLNQFDNKIYKKHNTLYIDNLSRKDKICDMEKPVNRLKMIRFSD